ncbi:hypothetical protein ACLRAE_12450 [Bordetella bronchiseptica]|uniref:Bbp35 n=2 Tax=root TaxID=1 RepID=Q775B0_BPBPP|nr:hypothetical protein [Bordetella bronchiseptica]NP_958704.1 hypothetical protein bbp35 [Bordetella phage BPP-1]KCV27796.1 hypothetical protein L489_5672 [Bordetella bronchiseptica 00-P-2730]AAR97700.1 Bbp35 [Bordetella phage BPP-1]AWP74464.1 hypothetical protein B7P10_08305 [Bordetella bronchiseptica]KCV30973.1 hypothetical protein L490_1451 [Bordetella bronchiseptica 00-P-2796]KDB80784.1 hypothetical protein L495_1745 [Bordetella bronchiseptica CARE970018BB]
MSLEAAIQENTSALRDLIAAIKAGVPTTAAQVAAVAAEAPAAQQEASTEKKPRATSAKTTAATAPTPPTAEVGAADAPESKAENSAPVQAGDAGQDAAAGDAAPTYQDTADAVTKLARVKGRDAAVAVLSKFGAAKLPDVKPEQFADVLAACNQAMEG